MALRKPVSKMTCSLKGHSPAENKSTVGTIPKSKQLHRMTCSLKGHSSSKNKSTVETIPKAKQLHLKFIELRDKYVQWASDEKRSNSLYIAQWCRALVASDRDRYGDRVTGDLTWFETGYRNDAAALRGAYEAKCQELVQLMKSPGFLAEFKKLEQEAQDNLYAELHEGFGESEVGRQHFFAELTTPTSLLMTTVFKASRKATTAFWRVLGETGATITVIKGKETIQYVEKLIVSKIDIVKADLLHAQWKLYPAGSIVPMTEAKTVTVFVQENVSVHTHFKTHRTLIGQTFDALNLAIALMTLREKQGTKEIAATAGALASFVDKLKKSTAVLAKAGLVRTAGKAVSVSVLAIVAGICETITGSIDAYNRWTKGDINAAVAYGTGAVAGAASAVGAGLILWGASTFWTGVGVVVFVAGAVVSLVSLIAGFLLDDDPLELWISNCRFGEDYRDNSAFQSWVDNPKAQVDALHEIITGMEFEADFKTDSHHVTVRPGLILACSKVTVTVEFSWSGIFGLAPGFGCQYRDTLVNKNWGVQTSGDRVTSFEIHVHHSGMKNVLYDEIDIAVNVDVYNDGKTLVYTRKATLTPSVLETITSWF